MNLFEMLKPQFQENAPWKKGVWGAIEKLGVPTREWEAFRYNSLVQINHVPGPLYHTPKIGYNCTTD